MKTNAKSSTPLHSGFGAIGASNPAAKLVVGLPTAMPGWCYLYGAGTTWRDLAPNPLLIELKSPAPRVVTEASHSSMEASVSVSARETVNVEASHEYLQASLGAGSDEGYPLAPVNAAASLFADPPFYCDACQKAFVSQEKYDQHMGTHIFCTEPGCRFTCRREKPWKMEEHRELLHNRPDAPNLEDVNSYLAQRRHRFPTQDAVKGKVEELYYKAARGAVLPDERRRWMQQHGIVIRKRPRTDASYIARGMLPTEDKLSVEEPDEDSAASRSESEDGEVREPLFSEQRREDSSTPASETSSSSLHEGQMSADVSTDAVVCEIKECQQTPTVTLSAGLEPRAVSPRTNVPPCDVSTSTPSSTQDGGNSSLKPKMIPLGPNGTFTVRQRAQLVRERYAASKDVPQFYVCNRCGVKGCHWVADCPTRGDASYDRHLMWGETKLSATKSKPTKTTEGVMGTIEDDSPPKVESARQTHSPAVSTGALLPPEEETRNREEKSDDATAFSSTPTLPPAPLQAFLPSSTVVSNEAEVMTAPDREKEVTRTVAPVAAAALARLKPRTNGGRGRPLPPPTLYERLTEEERLNEQGVVLQALRFFVTRRFFNSK